MTDHITLATEIAAQLADRLEKNFTVMPTLTLSQAAEAMGVSDEKMRQLCNEGKIPYIRMDRLYRIKPADVNAYLEQNYHNVQRPKSGDAASRSVNQNNAKSGDAASLVPAPAGDGRSVNKKNAAGMPHPQR